MLKRKNIQCAVKKKTDEEERIGIEKISVLEESSVKIVTKMTTIDEKFFFTSSTRHFVLFLLKARSPYHTLYSSSLCFFFFSIYTEKIIVELGRFSRNGKWKNFLEFFSFQFDDEKFLGWFEIV